MSQHARPHLQTHSRADNHSAVAGAAYRLGLRLLDERTGVCHDFRKRKLGEEIVRALTVAPVGSPAWATDPARLWNRVEQAEKRKDAQVARDYRIPIPFGLTDEQAGNLAEEMARFIASELHTPVSIGLHRDAHRDVLGQVKPDDKQGFHAHLYFPTRRLADVVKDAGEGREGSSSGNGAGPALKPKNSQQEIESTGFGAKLSLLSNKRTSIAFVEALNNKWADLANQYTTSSGLTADFDHRSYKRMGLNLTPQPTMGRSVAAMERQGVSTVKGDRLKEALAMAEVYGKVHAAELQVQRAQAVADRKRETSKVPGELSTRPTPALLSKVLPRLEHRRQQFVQVSGNPLGSMAARFHAAASSHLTESEREALERALFWVHLLERISATVTAMQVEAARLNRKQAQASAEVLTTEYNTHVAREHRAQALATLRKWEETHTWSLKISKLAGQGRNVDHQKLRTRAKVFDNQVQSFKKETRFHQQASAAARDELNSLVVKKIEQEAKLQKALLNLRTLGHDFEARMLAAASAEQKKLLVEYMKKEAGVEADQGSSHDEPTNLDFGRKSTLKL